MATTATTKIVFKGRDLANRLDRGTQLIQKGVLEPQNLTEEEVRWVGGWVGSNKLRAPVTKATAAARFSVIEKTLGRLLACSRIIYKL